MIRNISQNEFNEEVITNYGVVIVDFSATWCGPCKMLAPILESINNEMNDIKIVKIDIDENRELANYFGIQSIPTMKFFKNGTLITTKVGFQPKETILKTLKNI